VVDLAGGFAEGFVAAMGLWDYPANLLGTGEKLL
jgi:hypothetical protein